MPRNLKDATFVKTFALPASANTVLSAALDLGSDAFKPEAIEANISVPALNATMVPDTRTVTVVIETSTTSNFSAVSQTLYSEVFTGAGGAGIAAVSKLVRLPSNCARYIRGKVVTGASTGDATTISATFQLLF